MSVSPSLGVRYDTGWVLPCHPAGWSKAYTKTGEVYYRNKHDKTTTWDRPVLVQGPNGAGAGGIDKSGERGREKQETLPPAQASRRAEMQQPLAPGKLLWLLAKLTTTFFQCRSYLPELTPSPSFRYVIVQSSLAPPQL